MALSPLPEENTERWFYDYSVGGSQHSLTIRTEDGMEATAVGSAIDTFLSALSTTLATITTVGVRKAARGSNVTNPVGSTGVAPTYGTGAQSAIMAPAQLSFTGRSTDGRKARASMFGLAVLNDASWRQFPGENPEVQDAIDALTLAGTDGIFLSISGQRPVWHGYMNVGFNDHFVDERRRNGGSA